MNETEGAKTTNFMILLKKGKGVGGKIKKKKFLFGADQNVCIIYLNKSANLRRQK